MNSIDQAGQDEQRLPPQAIWSYTKTARVLHWSLAALLTAMVALGWYMMSIEKEPGANGYFTVHKTGGMIVLGLVLLRFVWRLSHAPQRLPSTVASWQAALALGTQWLLYLCMAVLPITGIAGASYSKNGIPFFGRTLPHPLPNHDLSEQFFSVHGVAVWVLCALTVLHIAGGLKHLLVDHDGVFQRMWRS